MPPLFKGRRQSHLWRLEALFAQKQQGRHSLLITVPPLSLSRSGLDDRSTLDPHSMAVRDQVTVRIIPLAQQGIRVDDRLRDILDRHLLLRAPLADSFFGFAVADVEPLHQDTLGALDHFM